ncbi:hypothetical protein [Agrobacterium tumefaciens]|uniref:Aldose 1-epimerase n=1 Tax=Agrobacterium tumefaciens TaxID=358 RepID=A0A4D7YRV9_AGRTU|nr:hypothetical protein [Agrobacterium tumefaciens]QCL97708.1 hypothetical protein CFBP7129_26130 [Agrobacterium tumefaciens]
MIELQSSEWRVTVSPEFGATILSADCRLEGGDWQPVFHTLENPEQGLSGGCFVMAPFANRIAGGRFDFDGKSISFPMNRPASNVACHGLARERTWTVIQEDRASTVLHCRIEEPDYPWRFSMTQRIAVADKGLSISLGLENIGTEKMPFGMGLHPWFPRSDDTLVNLSVPGFFEQDDAGLPLPRLNSRPAPFLDGQRPLADLGQFDGCACVWPSGAAQIIWPSRQLQLDLAASGALARFVHLYSPEDRDVFCIEPVSHPPDVLNRAELGEDSSMKVLLPGETMTGELIFRASKIKAARSAP